MYRNDWSLKATFFLRIIMHSTHILFCRVELAIWVFTSIICQLMHSGGLSVQNEYLKCIYFILLSCFSIFSPWNSLIFCPIFTSFVWCWMLINALRKVHYFKLLMRAVTMKGAGLHRASIWQYFGSPLILLCWVRKHIFVQSARCAFIHSCSLEDAWKRVWGCGALLLEDPDFTVWC